METLNPKMLNLVIDGVTEQLNKIEDEQRALDNKRRELTDARIHLIQEQLSDYVGKCYKYNGCYWCVVNVPAAAWDNPDAQFNEMLLPALIINPLESDVTKRVYFGHFWRGGVKEENGVQNVFSCAAEDLDPRDFFNLLQAHINDLRSFIFEKRGIDE